MRHRLAVSLAYDLPFSGNAWSTTGSCRRWAPGRPDVRSRSRSIRTSTPATPGDRTWASATTTGRTSAAIRRCRRAIAPRRSGSRRARYSFPAFGTFGNSGRNTLSGPGLSQRELAAIKADPVPAPRAAGALRGVQPVQHDQPRSCRTRSSDRRPSDRSCRRARRGGCSWGEALFWALFPLPPSSLPNSPELPTKQRRDRRTRREA